MSDPGGGAKSVREMAAAYALGALDPGEMRAFEELLAQSEDARKEVAEYCEVGALLALDAPAIQPPASLKGQVLDRIRTEKHAVTPIRRSAAPQWSVPLAWAAAVAGLIAGGWQWDRARQASRELALQGAELRRVAAQLARREETLNTILEPSTELLTMTSAERPPKIQIFWNHKDNVVVLHAFNLTPTASGRAYQLWFLRDRKGAPVPSVTFNPEPDGHALVTLPGPGADVSVIGAAVTEEPAGGSAQPTTTPILVGTLRAG